jgi:hypothetical protein
MNIVTNFTVRVSALISYYICLLWLRIKYFSITISYVLIKIYEEYYLLGYNV